MGRGSSCAVETNGDFEWFTSDPPPLSGARTHGGNGEHGFQVASPASTLPMTTGSILSQDVFLDPKQPPASITITWHFNTLYSNSAHWCDFVNYPGYGIWMGPLPKVGEWARLGIPGNLIGNVSVEGMTWNVVGGRAAWDKTERLW